MQIDPARGFLVARWQLLRNGQVSMVTEHHRVDPTNGVVVGDPEPLTTDRWGTDTLLRDSRWALTAPLATWLHREQVWVDQPLPFQG